MFFNLIHCFMVSLVAVTFTNGLQCRLTTNVGNVSDAVADLGKRLILNCSNIDRDDSVVVKWRKDGDLIKNKSSSILFIYNLTREDAGKYQCILTKEHQKSKCMVFVKINAPPIIVTAKSCCVLNNGLEMKLTCLVNGHPKPNIKWDSNNCKITDDCVVERLSEVNGQNYWWMANVTEYLKPNITENNNTCRTKDHCFIKPPLVNGQNYWLMSATATYIRNGASFTCKAENIFGKTNASTAEVSCLNAFKEKSTVCPKFENLEEKDNITIDIGKSITMQCRVEFPRENKRCYKHEFHRRPHGYNESHMSVWNILFLSATYARLVMNYTIVNASRNDMGNYTCFHHFKISKISPHCKPLSKTYHLLVREPSVISPRRNKNVLAAVAVSVTVVIIGFALILVIWFLRRRRLTSQQFYDSLPELRWDVFVSYSSKDFTWVQELCETLEQPPFNLIVCLHQRDWELGRTVIDNMADSVYCSQKTLLIVSKNYLESSYCMQELQIAMNSEIGTKKINKDRIVLIKIDDVSLKKLPKTLRQKSYLDFSNSEQHKHFKTKLMKALPRREVNHDGDDDDDDDDDDNDDDDCLHNSNDGDVQLDKMTILETNFIT